MFYIFIFIEEDKQMNEVFDDEFRIEKYILQGKIMRVCDSLHNKIIMIKSREELNKFIEDELNINIGEEIKNL